MTEVRKGAILEKVVDLGINTRFLYIKDVDRKARKLSLNTFHLLPTLSLPVPPPSLSLSQVILTQHPLHQISYCAEDRRYDNIFAYIIKHTKKDKPTVCYVYETMDAEVESKIIIFHKLVDWCVHTGI